MGRSWSWLPLLLAGCTFSPPALTPNDQDLGTGVPDLAGGMQPDLAGSTDLAMPAMLMVTRDLPPASNDLTAEGTFDWAHFGFTNANSVDRKSPGPASITVTANTGLHQFTSYTPGFTWSDGAPTRSANDTHTGSYVNGINHGFTITLPADSVTHTAYLYLNTYNSNISFQASLADNSAAPYSETINAAGDHDVRYTLVYRASGKTTLQVTWTIVADSGMASADLLAVTIQ